MKITDFKNEQALELMENIIDPVSEIFSDNNFKELARNKKTKKIALVKYALANHKKPIIEVLAALNGQSVEEYSGTVLTMTAQLLEIFNDEEMNNFFSSLVETKDEKSSTEPTENTKETETT